MGILKFLQRFNTNLYDSVIPLGFNCQLAFNINRVHGYLESNLFNWSFIIDEERYIKALENPDLLFSQGYQYKYDSNMFECLATGVVFHGKNPVDEIKNDDPDIYHNNILREYEDVIGRTKHLSDKFRNLLNSSKRKCFMYVLDVKRIGTEKAFNFANSLYKLLKQKTENFDLVIICEEECYNDLANKIEESIKLRSVRYFAPISATTDKNVTDIKGWNKILNEFKVIKPKDVKKKTYKYEKE